MSVFQQRSGGPSGIVLVGVNIVGWRCCLKDGGGVCVQGGGGGISPGFRWSVTRVVLVTQCEATE